MRISKITYVIIICLFIGAFGSYLFRHYVLKTGNQKPAHVQTAATENPTTTKFSNNPINPSTGIPDKAEVISTLPDGALVYKSPTDKTPYGVINKDTILNVKKKVGNLYEIDFGNSLLYINDHDITFNIK